MSEGTGWWSPMLAKVWDDAGTLPMPLYVQRKLDGIRGLWDGYDFWSRSGKPLAGTASLLPEMREHFSGVRLDGELWHPDMGFEEISSRVRGKRGGVEYWVYDTPSQQMYESRMIFLEGLFHSSYKFSYTDLEDVRLLSTQMLHSNGPIQEMLERAVSRGWEGLILRLPSSLYEHKRSKGLLKCKLWISALARIIGTVPGKGKHLGRMGALCVESVGFGWSCKVGTGFTDREREQDWLLGRIINMEYQELTKYGVPRFPRYKR